VQILGTNTPITDGGHIGFDGYICWTAEIFDVFRGCKLGKVFHCGLLAEPNVCGDLLADTRDLYVFNNGDTITFGGIASAHPTIPGSEAHNEWDLVTSIYARNDNVIGGSGKYKNIKGRRSLSGYIKSNTNGTIGSINEYHTLQLRFNTFTQYTPRYSSNDNDSDESVASLLNGIDYVNRSWYIVVVMLFINSILFWYYWCRKVEIESKTSSSLSIKNKSVRI